MVKPRGSLGAPPGCYESSGSAERHEMATTGETGFPMGVNPKPDGPGQLSPRWSMSLTIIPRSVPLTQQSSFVAGWCCKKRQVFRSSPGLLEQVLVCCSLVTAMGSAGMMLSFLSGSTKDYITLDMALSRATGVKFQLLLTINYLLLTSLVLPHWNLSVNFLYKIN